MKATKKLYAYMTPFQWLEVLAVVGFTIYFAATDSQSAWWYILVSSISAICGIFCVVLCAAGKKAQYYWGFVNIIAYIAVAWFSRYYGEVMLNALYYLPTQFVGLYFWNRHYNQESETVKSKKMTGPAIVASLAAIAVCIVGYRMVLVWLGGNSTWFDSASTAFSLVANALMVMRYREQWVLWIVVDAITVALWVLAGDPIQTTMWAVFLLNAFYGLYLWSKLNRAENVDNE
ncbi:MAG: nicotinamide riboside transporter PnuC [Eggerthellaceae bacterium]|nr:nicotinamide riboside transporter PnuC [Eggerthellaceae bacterium]